MYGADIGMGLLLGILINWGLYRFLKSEKKFKKINKIKNWRRYIMFIWQCDYYYICLIILNFSMYCK